MATHLAGLFREGTTTFNETFAFPTQHTHTLTTTTATTEPSMSRSDQIQQPRPLFIVENTKGRRAAPTTT